SSSSLPGPRQPLSTLFPYTTLFRSSQGLRLAATSRPGPTCGQISKERHGAAGPRGLGLQPDRLPYFRFRALQSELYGGTRSANGDRKSTRLNSSHVSISYAVFCLKK